MNETPASPQHRTVVRVVRTEPGSNPTITDHTFELSTLWTPPVDSKVESLEQGGEKHAALVREVRCELALDRSITAFVTLEGNPLFARKWFTDSPG